MRCRFVCLHNWRFDICVCFFALCSLFIHYHFLHVSSANRIILCQLICAIMANGELSFVSIRTCELCELIIELIQDSTRSNEIGRRGKRDVIFVCIVISHSIRMERSTLAITDQFFSSYIYIVKLTWVCLFVSLSIVDILPWYTQPIRWWFAQPMDHSRFGKQ